MKGDIMMKSNSDRIEIKSPLKEFQWKLFILPVTGGLS